MFGEAFVRVLAAAAGLTVAKAEPDVTGDDFTLGYVGPLAGIRNPKIDVQVKSRARPRVAWRSGFWTLRMKAHHFNELAGNDYALPRYLFLVIVPDDQDEYVTASPHALSLQHCAYWVSLEDQTRVDSTRQTSVTVEIPVHNLLSVEVLKRLLEYRMPESRSRDA
jgi:Domain of unknown function (DUF4365)